ncbi:MAG: hypothetical protein MI807_22275 [Verrucomicrobiales bacterium]|nr:hypothetical protein [Verrucomicrobiales bacterium]
MDPTAGRNNPLLPGSVSKWMFLSKESTPDENHPEDKNRQYQDFPEDRNCCREPIQLRILQIKQNIDPKQNEGNHYDDKECVRNSRDLFGFTFAHRLFTYFGVDMCSFIPAKPPYPQRDRTHPAQ